MDVFTERALLCGERALLCGDGAGVHLALAWLGAAVEVSDLELTWFGSFSTSAAPWDDDCDSAATGERSKRSLRVCLSRTGVAVRVALAGR